MRWEGGEVVGGGRCNLLAKLLEEEEKMSSTVSSTVKFIDHVNTRVFNYIPTNTYQRMETCSYYIYMYTQWRVGKYIYIYTHTRTNTILGSRIKCTQIST